MCQLFVRHLVATQLVAINRWFYRYNAGANFHHINFSDEAARADALAANYRRTWLYDTAICNVDVTGLL